MSPPPALFVSHGAPTLVLSDAPAKTFLERLGPALPRPAAILAISAHWETPGPTVSVADDPETIHDFFGFPRALHEMTYPVPGAPELAHDVAARLQEAGLGPVTKAVRGLDHGAWVPLKLAYPEADVPVTQLSIQPDRDPGHHFRIGQALRPLREEGVLLLASGSLTHNLGEVDLRQSDAATPDWVVAFQDWIGWAVAEGRVADLLDYRRQAPHAARNHPTDEHLLPLFVALGAGDPGAPGRHLHSSRTFGALAMDAYAFGELPVSRASEPASSTSSS